MKYAGVEAGERMCVLTLHPARMDRRRLVSARRWQVDRQAGRIVGISGDASVFRVKTLKHLRKDRVWIV